MPLGVALAMSLGGIAVGFALARLLAPAAVAGPPPPLPQPAAAEVRASAPVAPAGSAALAATPPRGPARSTSGAAPDRKRGARQEESSSSARRSGTGVLEVTAPDGAEVWLDGRRIGTGNTRRRIAEGSHRVEVRHRGAVVAERFRLFPGETWTYSVTPQ